MFLSTFILFSSFFHLKGLRSNETKYPTTYVCWNCNWLWPHC